MENCYAIQSRDRRNNRFTIGTNTGRRERDHLLLRVDFNARIGNEESLIKKEIGEKGNKIRRSIDKVVIRA